MLEEGDCELKNIATAPESQGKGYGRAMVDYLSGIYRERCRTMYVGTGETPKTLRFYRGCGFRDAHRVEGFFTNNYRERIIDDGVLLKDMVDLKKTL